MIHIITIAMADGVIFVNDDVYLQLALGTCPYWSESTNSFQFLTNSF